MMRKDTREDRATDRNQYHNASHKKNRNRLTNVSTIRRDARLAVEDGNAASKMVTLSDNNELPNLVFYTGSSYRSNEDPGGFGIVYKSLDSLKCCEKAVVWCTKAYNIDDAHSANHMELLAMAETLAIAKETLGNTVGTSTRVFTSSGAVQDWIYHLKYRGEVSEKDDRFRAIAGPIMRKLVKICRSLAKDNNRVEIHYLPRGQVWPQAEADRIAELAWQFPDMASVPRTKTTPRVDVAVRLSAKLPDERVMVREGAIPTEETSAGPDVVTPPKKRSTWVWKKIGNLPGAWSRLKDGKKE
ncbi:hypothetical protein OQA88_5091 [Cercophora sp. LCS_1]